jgi:WD40 repeat protein
MNTRRLLTSLDFGQDLIYSLSFDPHGRWLGGGTANGRAWVLDLAAVAAGKPAHDALVLNAADHKGGTWASALGADNEFASVGVSDGRVHLWNIVTRTQIVELGPLTSASPGPVAFSTDGRDLLYTEGNVVRRYPLRAGDLIQVARSRLTRGLTADECQQYLKRPSCGSP